MKLDGVGPETPLPSSAAQMARDYAKIAASLPEEMKKQWTDADLKTVDDMYGEKWSRAQTLAILVSHQTHHRGQMSVLMRQAGLKVPGVYGPAREEWAGFGMSSPEV